MLEQCHKIWLEHTAMMQNYEFTTSYLTPFPISLLLPPLPPQCWMPHLRAATLKEEIKDSCSNKFCEVLLVHKILVLCISINEFIDFASCSLFCKENSHE